jgi:hypothetical protein
LVFDAVESVQWPGKRASFSIYGDAGFRPEMLLSLLTYCYATGVFSSQDIEAACRQDPVARYLCANNFPDAKTLRRFRRLHREQIRQSLANLFQRAAQIRFGESADGAVPADHFVALALDRWFEPLCVPSPRQAADERLDRAGFVDGMLMVD